MLDSFRVQHSSDVPGKCSHGCAYEHGLSGVVDCDIEIHGSIVFVLPGIVTTTTCLAHITIVNVWKYFQTAFFLAEPCIANNLAGQGQEVVKLDSNCCLTNLDATHWWQVGSDIQNVWCHTLSLQLDAKLGLVLARQARPKNQRACSKW